MRPARPTARRGAVLGIGLGVVGLGCCVGPAVAAMLGITTATVAVDLATDLYEQWGWAFKLAAACLAILAVLLTRRTGSECSLRKPRVGRFTAALALSAVATYALLYAGTTWLGGRA